MRAIVLVVLAIPLAAALPPSPAHHDVAYVGPAPHAFGEFFGESDFACHGQYSPLFGHGYPGACIENWDGSLRVDILDASGLPVAGYVGLVDDGHHIGGFQPFCAITYVWAPSSYFHVRVYPAGAQESAEHCGGAFTLGATSGIVRFTDV